MPNIKVKASKLKKSTKEDIQRLKSISYKDIEYDEDCPPLTNEQLLQFRKARQEKDRENRKEVLSVRIKQSSMNRLKALGPGYSNVVAKLIDIGLSDPELLKRCL